MVCGARPFDVVFVLRDPRPGEQSPQLLFSDLEVDRLKIAFDMHSTSAARDSGGGLAAGPTAGGDENFVRIEDLKDLLRTLFIVSHIQQV